MELIVQLLFFILLEGSTQNNRDSGWAWVVMMSAILADFLTYGIIRAFPVVYLQILDYFHQGDTLSSLIPALYSFVGHLSGM